VALPFWTLAGHERFVAMNGFFEHLGLIGAFAMAAILAHRRQTVPKAVQA
jgi:hypothetical protein